MDNRYEGSQGFSIIPLWSMSMSAILKAPVTGRVITINIHANRMAR